MDMNRLSNSLRYSGLALFSGVMLWLSWPERGWTPLIFIALIPLLWIERQYERRKRSQESPRGVRLVFPGHGNMEFTDHMVDLEFNKRRKHRSACTEQCFHGSRMATFLYHQTRSWPCNRISVPADVLDRFRIPSPQLGDLLALAHTWQRFLSQNTMDSMV